MQNSSLRISATAQLRGQIYLDGSDRGCSPGQSAGAVEACTCAKNDDESFMHEPIRPTSHSIPTLFRLWLVLHSPDVGGKTSLCESMWLLPSAFV